MSFLIVFCLVPKYLDPTDQRVGLTLPTNHPVHAKISLRKQRRFHMKNQKYLFTPFLLTILIFAFFAAPQVGLALAQEQCLDATGAPIPCPTEIPCGLPGGPACPPDNGGGSATKTPRPIANPTEETSTAGATWSGSCSGGHSAIV